MFLHESGQKVKFRYVVKCGPITFRVGSKSCLLIHGKSKMIYGSNSDRCCYTFKDNPRIPITQESCKLIESCKTHGWVWFVIILELNDDKSNQTKSMYSPNKKTTKTLGENVKRQLENLVCLWQKKYNAFQLSRNWIFIVLRSLLLRVVVGGAQNDKEKK